MVQVVIVVADLEDEGNPWLSTVALVNTWEEAIEIAKNQPAELLTQITMSWTN